MSDVGAEQRGQAARPAALRFDPRRGEHHGQHGRGLHEGRASTPQIDALKSGIAFNEQRHDRRRRAAAHGAGGAGVRVQLQPRRDAAVGRRHRPHEVQRAVERQPGLAFHHLSHRTQSDGASGTNPTAEAGARRDRRAAHDSRCCTGLDAFTARGLQDKAVVCGRTTSRTGRAQLQERAPHHLGQRRRLPEAGRSTSTPPTSPTTSCSTRSSTAAMRDKSTAAVNFGSGTGTGEIAGMKA